MPNLSIAINSGDFLDVRTFHVHAGMNQPYRIDVVAVSDAQAIDFEQVIGEAATFTMSRGAVGLDAMADDDATAAISSWHGVCAEIRSLRTESTGLATYRLSVVPALWVLGHRTNNRIYQYLSEVDIVLALLKEWGIEPEVRVDLGSHKKRKYKVQYEESDLDFVHRMLEEAGVAYYFSADEGPTELNNQSRMVLIERPELAKARADLLRFFDAPPANRKTSFATGVELVRRVAPGRYTLRDHDYRKPPTYPLLSSSQQGVSAEEKLEIFDYVEGAFLYSNEPADGTTMADRRGKARTDEAQGKQLVARRLQAIRAESSVVHFETNAYDVGVGTVLGIGGHPRTDLERDKVLVTDLQITGDHSGTWTMLCEGVTAKKEYRPPLRTPRPIVNGVESATVVGMPSEEIHTDEFGRCQVHFHWDRDGKMDDTATCWMHVSQPWGGAGFGGSALARVGQEVLVEFMGGDPDRPVVVGRVYTALQTKPYALPANKTQSGIKSNSTNGTGGYNEIMFEDKAGGELLRIQAQKDRDTVVKNNCDTKVGATRSTRVGSHESKRVGGHQRNRIRRGQSTSVGADQSNTVGGGHWTIVQGTTTLAANATSITSVESFVSQAKATAVMSSDLTVLMAGETAFIVIRPDVIVINAPQVLINPGGSVTKSIMQGGEVPPSQSEIDAKVKEEAEQLKHQQEEEKMMKEFKRQDDFLRQHPGAG